MTAEPDRDTAPLVLIVEDDLATRRLYRDFLSTAGFRVIDAHNGKQALQKAQECRPAAIVTDLAVPGIDGFEFCRALQQTSETRSIPVIAVTGHAEYLDDPERFRHAGIVRVFTKPCALEEVAAALRVAL